MYSVIIVILCSTITTLLNTERLFGGGAIYFIAANSIICFSSILVSVFKNHIDIKFKNITTILLLCQVIYCFIQYEISCQRSETLAISREICYTVILQILSFIIAYFFARYSRESIYRLISVISFISFPILLIFISFGKEVNGSHCVLIIGDLSIISLGVITLFLPFALSFILDVDSFKYKLPAKWNLSDFRTSHMILFFYIMLAGALLISNKDLGSFMIVSLTMLFMCLPSLRKPIYKILLIFGAIGGAVFLTYNSTTARHRIADLMLQTAESDTLYFFSEYRRAGFFGSGIGSVSAGRFRYMEADYILNVVFCHHGILMAAACIFLLIALLWRLNDLKYIIHHSSFMKNFYKSSILMIAIPFLYCTGSTFLLLPVTGISFPLLAHGKTLVCAYTMLIALLLGFYIRIKKELCHEI